MRLLIATHNQGKVVEIGTILADAGIDCVSLSDMNITLEVPENAATFAGNASLKATGYARATGLLTLADDSGLAVAALAGEPGVLTARYGGSELTSRERYTYLLAQLAGAADRSASFHCAMVLATPATDLKTTFGELRGEIALQPAGNGGFGYDPVFFLSAYGQTLAELPAAIKNKISHRGQALAGMIPFIRDHAAMVES